MSANDCLLAVCLFLVALLGAWSLAFQAVRRQRDEARRRGDYQDRRIGQLLDTQALLRARLSDVAGALETLLDSLRHAKGG